MILLTCHFNYFVPDDKTNSAYSTSCSQLQRWKYGIAASYLSASVRRIICVGITKYRMHETTSIPCGMRVRVWVRERDFVMWYNCCSHQLMSHLQNSYTHIQIKVKTCNQHIQLCLFTTTITVYSTKFCIKYCDCSHGCWLVSKISKTKVDSSTLDNINLTVRTQQHTKWLMS